MRQFKSINVNLKRTYTLTILSVVMDYKHIVRRCKMIKKKDTPLLAIAKY